MHKRERPGARARLLGHMRGGKPLGILHGAESVPGRWQFLAAWPPMPENNSSTSESQYVSIYKMHTQKPVKKANYFLLQSLLSKTLENVAAWSRARSSVRCRSPHRTPGSHSPDRRGTQTHLPLSYLLPFAAQRAKLRLPHHASRPEESVLFACLLAKGSLSF